MTETIAQRRLFFALWPDAGVCRQLVALQREARAVAGGRAMKRETLHMTLAFLGNVPADRVSAVEEVAGALRGRAFDLELDRLALWRHNHIVWAGTDRVPEALAELAAELSNGLEEAGSYWKCAPSRPTSHCCATPPATLHCLSPGSSSGRCGISCWWSRNSRRRAPGTR